MFSYNIQWGATKKEVERSNFFLEVPKIIKRFRVALIICWLLVATMIILSLDFVPLGWRIPGTSWGLILPLAIGVVCHVLFPVRCARDGLLRIMLTPRFLFRLCSTHG
jgi:hypothetical protein